MTRTCFRAVHTLRPTHDPAIDTFRVEYLIGPSAILALIFNYNFTFVEILWSFSIFLESVAIIPQLFMLQRTGKAETITTHYLAALGVYLFSTGKSSSFPHNNAIVISIDCC